MTRSLSAEEIAELLEARRVAQEALSVPGPLTQRGYEARRAFSDLMHKHEVALLAMASRLVELEAALSFVSQFPGEIRCAAPLEPSLLPAFAAGLGWPGPTSQAKGG